MDNSNLDLLTVADVCQKLRISRNTTYSLLSSKQLDGFKVGRVWKIPAENIRHYIENQSVRNGVDKNG